MGKSSLYAIERGIRAEDQAHVAGPSTPVGVSLELRQSDSPGGYLREGSHMAQQHSLIQQVHCEGTHQ